jgi:hypothetical protein
MNSSQMAKSYSRMCGEITLCLGRGKANALVLIPRKEANCGSYSIKDIQAIAARSLVD